MPKFSTAAVEQLKRKAKQLCRDTPLTHSEALDQTATACGYANWSLLMKHGGPDAPERTEGAAVRMPFEFQRTLDEMRQALRVIPYRRYGPLQDELARKEVEDICLRFVSPANAVEYAIRYMTLLLQVPRFSINSGAKVYHEMRRWLPYYVQSISDNDDGRLVLVNRHYKPVGMTSSEWVDYEKYPPLHVQLDARQLARMAHSGSAPGYLFNDGCPPWSGRRASKAYLGRLHALQGLVRGG